MRLRDCPQGSVGHVNVAHLGGSGAPPAFVLHQGGQQLRFVRRAEAGRNADDPAPR